jgi:hypothetical protein
MGGERLNPSPFLSTIFGGESEKGNGWVTSPLALAAPVDGPDSVRLRPAAPSKSSQDTARRCPDDSAERIATRRTALLFYGFVFAVLAATATSSISEATLSAEAGQAFTRSTLAGCQNAGMGVTDEEVQSVKGNARSRFRLHRPEKSVRGKS